MITPVLLLSGVRASIGSSYAGLCNGQHCVHICLSLTFSTRSPLSASLGFVVSDFGFLVIGFSMNFEILYQLFHCALAFFACSWLCSLACCLALLFCLLLALLFLPAVWRCSCRIRHFIDVLGCCTRTRALSSLFSSESHCGILRFRGSTLVLLLHHHSSARDGREFSFHGTVGYYNVSCGLLCFSDHRHLIRNVMRTAVSCDCALHLTHVPCPARGRPHVSEFCVSGLRC